MMLLKTRLFSWVDVEDFLLTLRDDGQWPAELQSVQAYWDGLTLEVEPKAYDKAAQWIADIFEPRYQDGAILLESLEDYPRTLPVQIAERETDGDAPTVFRPTFQSPTVIRSFSPKADLRDFPTDHSKLIVFHSFKGGVGRTIHALATALAISEKGKDVLLVDADMEAPGITWMLADRMPNPAISFADFLTLVHGAVDKSGKDAIDLIAKNVQTSRLERIYLLPAFRSKEQLSRLQVKPENLTQWHDNPFIIADTLSHLGKRLDVSAVIVDVRAGLSEYSSGLLLDPHVHRILVTTLSSQSLEGTQYLLKLLNEMTPPEGAHPSPKIIFSQIPDDYIREKEVLVAPKIHKIEDAAKAFWNIQEPLGLKQPHVLLTTHEQHLMVLPGAWDDVMALIRRSELLLNIKEQIERWGFVAPQGAIAVQPSQATEYREKCLRLLEKLMDTESGRIESPLATSPLRNLANDFQKILPMTIVSGKEGTGKTFAFLHIIRCGGWNAFLKSLGMSPGDAVNALCCPVLCPEYLRDEGEKIVRGMEDRVKSELGFFETISDVEAKQYLLNRLESNGDSKSWRDFWLDLMAWRMGIRTREPGAGRQLIHFLREKKKNVIAVIDGLEDLLMDIRIKDGEDGKNHSMRTTSFFNALKYLIIDVPTWLDQQSGERRMGVLAFMRDDLIQNAVYKDEANLVRHVPYELKWNDSDARKLSSWIFEQALGGQPDAENAMAEDMIPALSDANGQIRPIDVVRFMRSAIGTPPDQETQTFLPLSSIRKAGKDFFMELTPKQEMKLRRLSDERLYPQAKTFIEENKTVKMSQISGLESVAESADGFSKVMAFVSHQAEKGRKDREKRDDFFIELRRFFEKLKTDMRSDQDFIPDADSLTRKQLNERVEFFGLLFAREFIHHLAAENRYRLEE